MLYVEYISESDILKYKLLYSNTELEYKIDKNYIRFINYKSISNMNLILVDTVSGSRNRVTVLDLYELIKYELEVIVNIAFKYRYNECIDFYISDLVKYPNYIDICMKLACKNFLAQGYHTFGNYLMYNNTIIDYEFSKNHFIRAYEKDKELLVVEIYGFSNTKLVCYNRGTLISEYDMTDIPLNIQCAEINKYIDKMFNL